MPRKVPPGEPRYIRRDWRLRGVVVESIRRAWSGGRGSSETELYDASSPPGAIGGAKKRGGGVRDDVISGTFSRVVVVRWGLLCAIRSLGRSFLLLL